MKSLVEKGELAQLESAVKEAENEWFDKTKKAADAIKDKSYRGAEKELDEFYESMDNLEKTKERVAENIQKRHQDAGKTIKESLEKIRDNGKEIEASSKKIKDTNDSIDEIISKKINANSEKIKENTNDSKLDEIDDILGSLSL